MNDFIRKFQHQLSATLSGFDRVVFRGKLWHDAVSGMKGYLWAHHVGAKDFPSHVDAVSERVKQASVASFLASGRPVLYLNSGKENKQQIAIEIAARDGIREGPICALTAVELCTSYKIGRNQKTQLPDLMVARRKCLFVYHYWIHPVFGFMSARLQTWFPFPLYLYMNGREWLARQMDQAGIRYRRHDNCFTWVEDPERAQALLDQQVRTNWVEAFDPIVHQVHPLLFSELCVNYPMKYFWVCQDSEWATDLVFRDPAALRRLMPRLLQLGVITLSSPDVLRFMGKKVTRNGNAAAGLKLPLSSDLKIRVNGARIKHRLGPNSVKLYDKAYDESGAVLRAEVTISQAAYFQVYRRTDKPHSEVAKRNMRQSIIDMPHRAVVSQQIVDRYYCELAAVDDTSTLEELTSAVGQRVIWNQKSVRGLRPFDADDHALLQAVHRGEFTITGVRNKDLQQLLYSMPPKHQAEQRRRSASVTRKLRILRAHGLISRRHKSHRYDVTAKGRLFLNAVLLARTLTVQQITALAA
jgi:hypothetical protein